MRESLRNTERGLIFRETFNDQQAVERNGGVIIGDISFDNGRVIYAGDTDYINIKTIKVLDGKSWTINIKKLKSYDFSINKIIFGEALTTRLNFLNNTRIVLYGLNGAYTGIDWNGEHTFEIGVDYDIVFACDGTTITLYINGVIVSTKTPSDGNTAININRLGYDSGAALEGSYDLFEVYGKEFSAEEVSNLYNSSRHFELAGHREQYGLNQVFNAGTPETTDWIDTNDDGLADEWTIAEGVGSASIETGNGFIGNCQRINHITGTTTRLHILLGVTLPIGRTYKVTGKFRTNAVNWRIYGNTGTASFTTNMGVNSGDAISFEYIAVSTGNVDYLTFYKHATSPSSYLEVDEVTLEELKIEEVKEILNVSAQSGSIVNKYAGETVQGLLGTTMMDEGKGFFDTDTESWVKWGTNVLSNENGALVIEYIDSASAAYVRLANAYDLNSDLVIGKSYRVRMKVKMNLGGASLNANNDGVAKQLVTGFINTEYEWIEGIFVAGTTVSDYIYFTGMGVGEKVYVDAWYLEEIISEPVLTATEVVKDGDVRGMFMNGVDSKVDCGDYLVRTFIDSDITILMWIKTQDIITQQHLFALYDIVSTDRWVLGIDSGEVRIGELGASEASGSISIGEWTFIAVRKTSTGVVELFLNDVKQVGNNPMSSYYSHGISTAMLGIAANSLNVPYSGYMDDTKLKKGLLTDEEISQAFTSVKHKYGL